MNSITCQSKTREPILGKAGVYTLLKVVGALEHLFTSVGGVHCPVQGLDWSASECAFADVLEMARSLNHLTQERNASILS